MRSLMATPARRAAARFAPLAGAAVFLALASPAPAWAGCDLIPAPPATVQNVFALQGNYGANGCTVNGGDYQALQTMPGSSPIHYY